MIKDSSNKKLMIGVCSFVVISIIGIIYAAFTGQLNINGSGINRKGNFDIYFNNVSNFLTTGTATVTDPNPTVRNHTTVIEDYEATLVSPTDSIYFTFDIVNDGDYDATLTSLTLGPVKCSVNGNESDTSAQNVCSNIEYTMKYTDSNSNVTVNDTLASKETKEVRVTLTYKEFSDSSELPTSNVTISNLGIDMVYTADSEAKTNKDGSTPKITAVSALLSKTNDASVTTYETGSEASHQMYTFSHPATEQTPALIDYRYIGSDPYNYVDFNGETWRIIGIFTVEDGNGNKDKRIKIIKDEYIGKPKWAYYRPDQSPKYENEWSRSFVKDKLNGYFNGLSSSAKEMIDDAKYYLGGVNYDVTLTYGNASDMYNWERGIEKYDESRSLNWIGKMGLMYPSDYAYTYANGVSDQCYRNEDRYGHQYPKGWFYKEDEADQYRWLISPRISQSLVMIVGQYGGIADRAADYDYAVYPVAYLIPDIQFDGDHTGSSSDHYQLKI